MRWTTGSGLRRDHTVSRSLPMESARPSRTKPAARTRVASVMKLSVPSSSSGPQRPALEHASNSASTSSSVMAARCTVLPFRPIVTENTDVRQQADAGLEANGAPRRQLGQETASKIPELILHLFEVRRSLEPFGAGLAALRASPKIVSELLALWTRYDTEFDTAAPEELIKIDEAIHATIAKASGNPLLTGILTSLASAAHRARLVTAQLPRVPERSREELQALVISISDRDPWRSEAAMQRHLIRLEEAARAELRRIAAQARPGADDPAAGINQD